MSANMVGFALLLLALMLFIGKVMRIRIKVTQKLFLPASIMGGFVALLLGPEVLGMLGGTIGGESASSSNPAASSAKKCCRCGRRCRAC